MNGLWSAFLGVATVFGLLATSMTIITTIFMITQVDIVGTFMFFAISVGLAWYTKFCADEFEKYENS